MKTLYILRHGKSSWEQTGMSDYDRPLLRKGEQKTQKIAKFLKTKGYIPSLIISSPAKRAKQTAKIISKELDVNLAYDDNLYPGNPESIFNILYSLENELSSVMIVGHNPGLTSVVRDLIDSNYDWLPTSGLAIGKYEIENWPEISSTRVKKVHLIAPKNL